MANMHTVASAPLAISWNQRRPDGYDVVIIGSGYGGAITAARLATANWPGAKPSVCVLERGKEWLPGQFPDNLQGGAGALRSDLNPLGLFDFHFGTDIGIIKGSGLGGTSLVNHLGQVFDRAGGAHEGLYHPHVARGQPFSHDLGALGANSRKLDNEAGRSPLHSGPHTIKDREENL